MDREISIVAHNALDYIVDVERITETMNLPLRLITRSTQPVVLPTLWLPLQGLREEPANFPSGLYKFRILKAPYRCLG